MIDQRIAALWRIAVRARLTTIVVGLNGSGRSSLLAALCSDIGEAMRVVTISRSRDLTSQTATHIELVASDIAPLTCLLPLASQIGPELLAVDGIAPQDGPALAGLVEAEHQGLLVGCELGEHADVLARSADLVVRLGRSRDRVYRTVSLQDAAGTALFAYEEGRFISLGRTPSFADKVRATSQASALNNLFT